MSLFWVQLEHRKEVLVVHRLLVLENDVYVTVADLDAQVCDARFELVLGDLHFSSGVVFAERHGGLAVQISALHNAQEESELRLGQAAISGDDLHYSLNFCKRESIDSEFVGKLHNLLGSDSPIFQKIKPLLHDVEELV